MIKINIKGRQRMITVQQQSIRIRRQTERKGHEVGEKTKDRGSKRHNQKDGNINKDKQTNAQRRGKRTLKDKTKNKIDRNGSKPSISRETENRGQFRKALAQTVIGDP